MGPFSASRSLTSCQPNLDLLHQDRSWLYSSTDQQMTCHWLALCFHGNECFFLLAVLRSDPTLECSAFTIRWTLRDQEFEHISVAFNGSLFGITAIYRKLEVTIVVQNQRYKLAITRRTCLPTFVTVLVAFSTWTCIITLLLWFRASVLTNEQMPFTNR